MPLKQRVLTELSNHRLLTAKIFAIEGEPKNHLAGKFHCGHQHYFNKLGLGDGERRMREIDQTLKKLTGGWGFEFHSFQPFVPEWSDEWAMFRDVFDLKDRLIGFRAVVANRVKGIVTVDFQGNPDFAGVNGVYFADAFGGDIDLWYYFTRSQMKKVAQINNAQDRTEDVVLEWELKLPDMEDDKKAMRLLVGTDKETISNEFATIGAKKSLPTGKQFLMGWGEPNIKRENYTYLRMGRAWDAKGLNVPVKMELITKGGKFYLRKTLLATDLQKVEGSVWTDTAASYYGGAGDGDIWHGGSGISWATVNGSADNVAYAVSSSTYCMLSKPNTGGYNYCGRAAFPFNTDPTVGSKINAASLFLRITGYYDYWSADARSRIDIIETNQASLSVLATSDWPGVTQPATCSFDLGVIGAAVGGFKEFPFDATGLTWIGATTKVAQVEGHLNDNVEPGAAVGETRYSGMHQYYSEQAGSDDPYMYIDFTKPGGASPMHFNNSGFAMG